MLSGNGILYFTSRILDESCYPTTLLNYWCTDLFKRLASGSIYWIHLIHLPKNWPALTGTALKETT